MKESIWIPLGMTQLKAAKACKEYGTQCRFNFPKFPIHKTVISIPLNYAFDDEKEKTKKMKRYSQVLDAEKEVLEDDEKMKKICTFNQIELDECTKSSKIRYRLAVSFSWKTR